MGPGAQIFCPPCDGCLKVYVRLGEGGHTASGAWGRAGVSGGVLETPFWLGCRPLGGRPWCYSWVWRDGVSRFGTALAIVGMRRLSTGKRASVWASLRVCLDKLSGGGLRLLLVWLRSSLLVRLLLLSRVYSVNGDPTTMSLTRQHPSPRRRHQTNTNPSVHPRQSPPSPQSKKPRSQDPD